MLSRLFVELLQFLYGNLKMFNLDTVYTIVGQRVSIIDCSRDKLIIVCIAGNDIHGSGFRLMLSSFIEFQDCIGGDGHQ